LGHRLENPIFKNMGLKQVISETWVFFIVGLLFAMLFYSKILNPTKSNLTKLSSIQAIYNKNQ